MNHINNHLKLCKPITACNPVLHSVGLNAFDWPDLFEYQGLIAAPMVDFHSGQITAIACTDGINSVSYVGGFKARQCGFYAGSTVKYNEEFTEFTGCEKPLIFCTDLLTSMLLNRITSLPVMFCTDIEAFRFSGATECFIRSDSQKAITSALHYCGAVDVWFPVGRIEQTRHVKWLDAMQAASLIEVSHG